MEERGKRLEVKSKVEDIEYDRRCGVGRGVAAASAPGAEASFDKESLREDEMPDGEEELERCDENGEEEAREASSRESRRG